MCDVSSFILAAKTGSHTAPSSNWRWAHTPLQRVRYCPLTCYVFSSFLSDTSIANQPIQPLSHSLLAGPTLLQSLVSAAVLLLSCHAGFPLCSLVGWLISPLAFSPWATFDHFLPARKEATTIQARTQRARLGDSTASSRTVHERIQPADTVMPCLL